MATRRIRDFLVGSGVSYSIASHPSAYTAQQVAQTMHLSGRYMAKNVLVCIDGQLAMAVIPATKQLDLDALRNQTRAGEVRLADETEFVAAFADCQVGTVPPFGNLFGVRTFVDITLALQELIAFNAGTHTDVIRMKYSDYSRLAKPLVVQIAMDPIEDVSSRQAKVPRRCLKDTSLSPVADSEFQSQMQCSCDIVHHVGSD